MGRRPGAHQRERWQIHHHAHSTSFTQNGYNGTVLANSQSALAGLSASSNSRISPTRESPVFARSVHSRRVIQSGSHSWPPTTPTRGVNSNRTGRLTASR